VLKHPYAAAPGSPRRASVAAPGTARGGAHTAHVLAQPGVSLRLELGSVQAAIWRRSVQGV